VDDSKLIELFFKRNEDAIRLTHEKYGGYCFAVANNILANREDAEECVNDAYLAVWNSIPPQRPKVFRLFLARITRNLSLNRYEKRAAKKRGGEAELALEELAECVKDSVSIESEVMAKELAEAVDGFLDTISRRDRGIFLYRYFYYESAEAIAKRFGSDPEKIYSILFRTRAKLRKYLEKEGYFNDR
jgi:RNA polymerase sigma-70 factor (ECF subfamily)